MSESPVTRPNLLAPVRSKAFRITLGLVILVVGAATLALLLLIAMHAKRLPHPSLLGVSAFLAAITIFCAIVALRLLRDTPNRKGHLLPPWFYFGLGCTLTAFFLADLWAMYKKGDFSGFVGAVLSFGPMIVLCLTAYRAAKKPAPGYREV